MRDATNQILICTDNHGDNWFNRVMLDPELLEKVMTRLKAADPSQKGPGADATPRYEQS